MLPDYVSTAWLKIKIIKIIKIQVSPNAAFTKMASNPASEIPHAQVKLVTKLEK